LPWVIRRCAGIAERVEPFIVANQFLDLGACAGLDQAHGSPIALFFEQSFLERRLGQLATAQQSNQISTLADPLSDLINRIARKRSAGRAMTSGVIAPLRSMA
jgi:hypothetical protein